MGYKRALNFTQHSEFGPVSKYPSYSSVDCQGTESTIEECKLVDGECSIEFKIRAS